MTDTTPEQARALSGEILATLRKILPTAQGCAETAALESLADSRTGAKAMKTIAVIFAVLLTGCDSRNNFLHEWEAAPLNRICTEEEMTRVQREALWCKVNTGYTGAYCYGTTIMQVCQTKRRESKP